MSRTDRENEGGHTSQLSRIAQSPAAADFSGGKASEALSTVRSNNFAAEAAVDIHPGPTLGVVASPWASSGTTGSPAPCVRGSDRNWVVYIPSDSPPREMGGVGALFLTSDRGGVSAWSVLS